MSRVTSESKSFKGSNVYLTGTEKDALLRAIDQYQNNVMYASDSAFIDFYQKHDEYALANVEKKLRQIRR